MDWTQVDIYTTTAGVEPVGAALLELNVGGYAVQDAADFEAFLEGKTGHWDYIDEDLLKLRDAETTLTIYLAQNAQGGEQLAALRQALERLRAADTAGEWGRLEYALTGVREEDWSNAWKQYYTPTKVGDALVVCPSWETYEPGPGEVVIRLDPGMAFGTGGHDSTRLCMRLTEQYLPRPKNGAGARVLDLGCGSGILAVAALLLGAEEATGVDIDEVAVRVAGENAALNGVADRCAFLCGSLADKVSGTFDVIYANIVADVILQFLPDVNRLLAEDGVLITSGIIDTREDDILAALPRNGLAVATRLESGGWVGLACKRG